MSVKKDAKTQLIKLCREMWLFFTPYNSCENKDIAEKHLACYDLIVKLTLLSWNTALVKSSFSAVEKTLGLINLRAYSGNEITLGENVFRSFPAENFCGDRKTIFLSFRRESVMTSGDAA